LFLFLTQIRTCKNMFMYLTNKVYEVEGIMLHKYTFVPHLSYRLLSDLELRLLWNTRDYYQTSNYAFCEIREIIIRLGTLSLLWNTRDYYQNWNYAFCEIREIIIRPGTTPSVKYERLLSYLELRLLWNTRDYYQTWDIKPSVKYERLLSDMELRVFHRRRSSRYDNNLSYFTEGLMSQVW
jgi:hypothetical protein